MICYEIMSLSEMDIFFGIFRHVKKNTLYMLSVCIRRYTAMIAGGKTIKINLSSRHLISLSYSSFFGAKEIFFPFTKIRKKKPEPLNNRTRTRKKTTT